MNSLFHKKQEELKQISVQRTKNLENLLKEAH